MWNKQLAERIDALGDAPTAAQQQSLSMWIVENVPKAYWHYAMDVLLDVEGFDDVYTDISMRDAECGNWMHN